MFFKSFWRSIVCLLIILLLSCIPSSSFKKISLLDILYIDKIIHLFMYFLLTIYLKYGLKNYFLHKKFHYSPALISIVYGGIMELIQHFFILGRSGEIIDFIFNSIGAFLACLVYEKLERRKLIL